MMTIVASVVVRKDDFKQHNAITQAIRSSGARVSSFYNAKTSLYYTIEFEVDSSYEAYCATVRRYTMGIAETYRKPKFKTRLRYMLRFIQSWLKSISIINRK